MADDDNDDDDAGPYSFAIHGSEPFKVKEIQLRNPFTVDTECLTHPYNEAPGFFYGELPHWDRTPNGISHWDSMMIGLINKMKDTIAQSYNTGYCNKIRIKKKDKRNLRCRQPRIIISSS